MAETKITLFGIYERHAKAGTTPFSWCDFVKWAQKAKPDIAILNKLKTLTPTEYEKALPKKPDEKKEPDEKKQPGGANRSTSQPSKTADSNKED
ncbi:MAG TPA: hypothetical protein PKB13_08805 [Clostridia bacterium]|nr:hypothetical protein [Clostridia bacterium]